MRWLAVGLGVCALQLGDVAAGSAQSHTFFPADHWTRGALYRLALTRQLDVSAAALSWPASRAEVLAWLDSTQARVSAGGNAASLERARFFRAVLGTEERAGQRLQMRLAVGGFSANGRLRAGTMQRLSDGFHYPGPIAEPAEQVALLGVEVHGRIAGPIALGALGTLRGERAELAAAYLTARFSRLEAWVGRRTLALGSGPGEESLVLNPASALDGAGISARRGLRVPLLGRVFPELLLARMQRSGPVRHPWFHATRITIAPSSALAIGLNRAAIFGGENHIDITPARVLLMLLGLPDVAGKDSDFENQVASADLLWRTRIGRAPIGLYAELGTDDTGFAFVRVPGLIVGVELAQVPALPALAMGVEIVHLAERCCSYPPWYQHGALADGWTDRGRLLGHTLGGAGTELALHGRVDLASTPLLAAGRLFVRERAAENLLSPLHEGRSVGARLELLLPWRRTQLQMRADTELGATGWQATSVTFLGNLYFE